MNQPNVAARQEWTLHDGATLVAIIEERPIDEYSVVATLIVHHSFDTSTQTELQALSYRFANPDSSGEWDEIKVTNATQTGTLVTQYYSIQFSAPDQSIIHFQVLKNAQAEELQWHTP